VAATGVLHKAAAAAAAEATNLAAAMVAAVEAMADKKVARANSNGRKPDSRFTLQFCASCMTDATTLLA
jgi:hypothetical protein